MIHKLYKSYNPITATPFQCTEEYMEFVPCDALKPYIRCFWGSKKAVAQEKNSVGKMGIVIPDTCMDIIFTVDFTNNKIFSSFCGIDDRTFVIRNDSKEKKTFLVFAIRFFRGAQPCFQRSPCGIQKMLFLMQTVISRRSERR